MCINFSVAEQICKSLTMSDARYLWCSCEGGATRKVRDTGHMFVRPDDEDENEANYKMNGKQFCNQHPPAISISIWFLIPEYWCCLYSAEILKLSRWSCSRLWWYSRRFLFFFATELKFSYQIIYWIMENSFPSWWMKNKPHS